MPYFEEGTITTTSIQLRLCDIPTNYNSRSIIWSIDGEEKRTTSVSDGKSNSDWITFSGLRSDNEYEIQAIVYGYVPGLGNNYLTDCSDTFITETDSEEPDERPDHFEWTYSKKSGKEFNLTAKEWNALCNNINDLLYYYGWYDYNFTTAYKGNEFTADMYNEILSAIYPISPRSRSYLDSYKVNPGDKIYASSLNDLVDLVNEC